MHDGSSWAHLAGRQRPDGNDLALDISRHAAGGCSCQHCVALKPFRVVPSMRVPPVAAATIILQCPDSRLPETAHTSTPEHMQARQKTQGLVMPRGQEHDYSAC